MHNLNDRSNSALQRREGSEPFHEYVREWTLKFRKPHHRKCTFLRLLNATRRTEDILREAIRATARTRDRGASSV